MKLRQKLAVVLASAMVVTAVPVVTMAASTATVSKVVTVSNDDEVLGSNAPQLSITLKDNFTSSSQFYLVLEEAKWDEDVVTTITTKNGVTGTVEPYSETEATVTFAADLATSDVIYIPLTNVIVTGNAVVKIDGNETEITDASFAFAKYTDSSKATVSAKSLKTFYTGTNKVGTVVVAENTVGDLAGQEIVIELEHNDYKFTGTPTITGTKGYSSATATEQLEASTIKVEDDAITITLPKTLTGSGKGAIEISGIQVKSTAKSPETGDLEVYVTGKKVTSTTVKVATVADYGTTLAVDKVDEVKAGKVATVELTYKQVTEDSVPQGTVEFTVDNGYFTEASLKELGIAEADFIYEDEDDKDVNEIIGFDITFGGTGTYKQFKEKEVKIQTKLGATGDVTVKTSGRYVEDQEVVVATVKETLKLDAEAMTLKVGQSKQVGGKLVLTEAEAGNFERGKVITLTLPEESGMSFTELPTVEANGLTVETAWKDSTSKSAIQIKVTKGSKEAGSITIKDFEVKVDRTVPQGYYDLKVAVENYSGTVKAKEFFVVGTPNTEELAANGLPKGTATFTINSAEYTVNGKVATMDVTAYIQDPGYTMVPVRYVATAFGVNPQDILYSNGTATIFAGSRTIQLTAGSDVAVVNGASIKLATKVVVKDGRTYAPVGEIARILGVSVNWDSASKVATFENK